MVNGINTNSNYPNDKNSNNNTVNLDYNSLKNLYSKFKKELSNSDFANSQTGYFMEHKFLDKLEEAAKKENLEKELEFIAQAKCKVEEKLEKLGIKFIDN